MFMYLLDPRQSRKGPMNSALSVHPSVCNTVLSELTQFFLIFCMKLEIRNMRKVTEPDFSEKFSLAQKKVKRAQNGLNMDFLISQNCVISFF